MMLEVEVYPPMSAKQVEQQCDKGAAATFDLGFFTTNGVAATVTAKMCCG